MTSVPNLRLQLNGNNQLWLILIVFLVASCDLFKPVQTDSPRSTDQDDELDEVQGRRVYDPETGTYIVIENAPTEKMDTIRWRNVPVDPEQIIRSSEESFIVDEPGAGPAQELGSEIIAPNVETKFLSSYNVTMMLPFLSDRFSPASEKLPANSDWALHFYSGAKMALEDLESEDISMTVSVIDGRETSMSAVQQLLRSSEDLRKAQLIIGPYRSETARLVADFAKRNNSVVFSPYTTSTEITSNNPNYVQVNPSLRSHCEAITRHARQRFNPEQIVLVCRDKPQEIQRLQYFQNENARISGSYDVPRLKEYIVSDEAELSSSDMFSLISLEDTTVFILPSWSNEAFIYNFLRNLDLARRENSKIVVYGMPQWMDYEIIDYDYYERLNVHVSSSTYLNPLSSDVQFFRNRFFDRYGTLPNEEAYLGYDVTMYCGKMLKQHGTKFQYALEQEPMQMLHTYFDFERVVSPTATSGTENLPIQRFENKYVNILKFQNYQFKLAD